MSQAIYSTINPDTTSGTMLAGILTDFKDAITSGMSGTSRPAQLQAGGMWIDTTNQSAPTYYWSFKFWTGSVDIEVFRLSVLYGYGGTLISDASFDVQHIAADTVGPILQLIKQRNPSINSAQVLNGDLVGEIRFIGRTATSTDPVVGYLQFTATDDMTAAAFGGTLSFASTPDATNALAEHLRFISGYVETIVPHKLNAQIQVSQNTATAPTITKLDATYGVAELTGSTLTSILSVDSAGNAKEISIHNRSSANIFLRNENAGGSAADRMTFPGGNDMTIKPQETIVLYYCTTDTRWKLKEATVSAPLTRTLQSFSGVTNSWTAPFTGRLRVTSYADRARVAGFNNIFVDNYGNYYSWGTNTNGGLGLGDVTARSSPVAVLGGINWNPRGIPPQPVLQVGNGANSNVAVDKLGNAYAWGLNTNGQLGVGDVTPRSSPVAVLGGFKFAAAYNNSNGMAFGLTFGGKLYAWGSGLLGLLGVGDVTPRSSPVAVLGGLTFSKIYATSSGTSLFALTADGTAYAWGGNNVGQLGVGDLVARSSPVAVLGGLKFSQLYCNGFSNFGITTGGVLYGWGLNSTGELGVGNQTNRSSPVAVLGGLTFTNVFIDSVAHVSVLASLTDGTLYAWGGNTNGNLGLGDTADRSSPVAVLGGLKFSRVSFGQSTRFSSTTVLGLATSGALYAWGANEEGQLGLGDVVHRSSPVAILGGLTFALPYSRGGLSHAFTRDGWMYAWGNSEKDGTHTNGESGLGDTTPRSSPVAVMGGLAFETFGKPVAETFVDVVSGTAYTITLSDALSTFGSTLIGQGVDRVTIAYDT